MVELGLAEHAEAADDVVAGRDAQAFAGGAARGVLEIGRAHV